MNCRSAQTLHPVLSGIDPGKIKLFLWRIGVLQFADQRVSKAGVPFDLQNVYQNGRHGIGLEPTGMPRTKSLQLCFWLKENAFQTEIRPTI